VAAADLLAEQRAGLIPVRQDGDIKIVSLRDVIRETRRVPESLFQLQRVFG
jgi:hypothetical protein